MFIGPFDDRRYSHVSITRLVRFSNPRCNSISFVTGVVLLRGLNGQLIESRSFHEATKVTFDNLADDVIKGYVATREPLDKAGTILKIYLNFSQNFVCILNPQILSNN